MLRRAGERATKTRKWRQWRSRAGGVLVNAAGYSAATCHARGAKQTRRGAIPGPSGMRQRNSSFNADACTLLAPERQQIAYVRISVMVWALMRMTHCWRSLPRV